MLFFSPLLKFVDAFPTDLLGFHPKHDIDLSLNLYSSTHSISIPLHCKEPASLKELNIQLQDLMSKGLIELLSHLRVIPYYL